MPAARICPLSLHDALPIFYVTNPGPNTVTVFAAGASGNATPATTISTISPANQTGYPTGIALDPAGNVYVTNNQYRATGDRKSTRLNSVTDVPRMPSSA